MKTEIYTQYAGGVVIAQNSQERFEIDLPLPSYTPMPSNEPAGETEFVDASRKHNALGESTEGKEGSDNTPGAATNLLGAPSDPKAPSDAGKQAGEQADEPKGATKVESDQVDAKATETKATEAKATEASKTTAAKK